MDVALAAGLLIGLAILVLFVGLARTIESPSADRLEEYLGERVYQAGTRPAQGASNIGSTAGELVAGLDKALRSASLGETLARSLRRADLKFTVTEFLLLWLMSTLAGAGLGYALSRSWLTAALVAVAGALLPYLFLRRRQTARLRAFDNQLHNVLMQMSGSMRAGYGLLQAIDFVAHETPPPAGAEFAQVARDVPLGRTTMAALADLTGRVPIDSLVLLVTPISIHHATGGHLAESMETVSETIRERVRIKGELRSLTAQQRIAGYVLGALPIIVFLVLMVLNPTYEARLFAPGPTQCIPFGAILMMLAGFIIIRRINSLEI